MLIVVLFAVLLVEESRIRQLRWAQDEVAASSPTTNTVSPSDSVGVARSDEEFDRLRGSVAEIHKLRAEVSQRRRNEDNLQDENRRLTEDNRLLTLNSNVTREMREETEFRKARSLRTEGGLNRSVTFELRSRDKLSLIDAITLSGGFSDNADRRKIEVHRDGTIHSVTLQSQLDPTDTNSIFWLKPGDVVRVNRAIYTGQPKP